ncbi:MAG: type II secretion system minor pseudopilin GspJ [Gammaproteobacteria bacterium]|nr:type II secretion system minor pseudopilin GspJ [Gammaproteobacteria bacterium]
MKRVAPGHIPGAGSSTRVTAGNRALEHGFTLLELLMALLVFAIMSVLAYGGLRSVLDASASAGAHVDRLTGLQRTFTVLSRDIEQLADRGIRDEYGDRQPPLRVGENELLLELTRAGWRNPAGQTRSTLQRVGYRLEEGTLYRLYWSELDRALESKANEAQLLDGVNEVTLRFLDQALAWHAEWPPLGSDGARLTAVEVVLELEDWGELRRVFQVVGE